MSEAVTLTCPTPDERPDLWPWSATRVDGVLRVGGVDLTSVAADFGTMVVCAQLPREKADQALGFYFGRTPTELENRHFWSYVVFAGWCWYVWALAKEAEGDDVGEWR